MTFVEKSALTISEKDYLVVFAGQTIETKETPEERAQRLAQTEEAKRQLLDSTALRDEQLFSAIERQTEPDGSVPGYRTL